MGIYDRDYYREDSRWSNPFSRSQGTLFLCLVYFFMFVAQMVTTGQGQRGFTEAFELNVDQVLRGEVWRVLTYALIHEHGNIYQVVFTIGFLIWIGHQVEDLYGTREYLAYFTFTSLLGGIVYTAVGAVIGQRRSAARRPVRGSDVGLDTFRIALSIVADLLVPDLVGHRLLRVRGCCRTGRRAADLRRELRYT